MTQLLHIFFRPSAAPLAVQVDDAHAPAAVAARVKTELAAAGHQGELILLGVPSAWCLAASVSTDGIAPHDRQALVFRFEEMIPLAAEDVVADFVHAEAFALGVCVRIDRLAPLVDALEAAGVHVQSISPTALLSADGADGIVLVRESEQTSVLLVTRGMLTSWALVESAEAERAIAIASMRFDAPPAVRTIDQLDEHAADRILAGTKPPLIELRRGALAARDRMRAYRRPLNAALAAAAVLLLVIAGTLLLKAHRYTTQEREDQAELASAFEKSFPGWALPPNVTAVIQSEHRKIGGRSNGALPAEVNESALRTMHRVLDKLPTDIPIHLEHMMFTDNSFELAGRLKSYEDADKLAGAARSAGLSVVPPQTRRESDGTWSFTLHAERPPATPPALAKQD